MLARIAGKRGYLIKVPAFVIASLTGTSVKYTYTISFHGLLTPYGGKGLLTASQLANA